MNTGDLLTVKEFAEDAGVSIQAVYKRLKNENNQLNNYVKIVEGKKLIDKAALSLFIKLVEQPVKQPPAEVEQLNQLIERLSKAESRIDELLKQNSNLTAIQAGIVQKQLQDGEREKEKDRTISELQSKVDELQAENEKLRAAAKESELNHADDQGAGLNPTYKKKSWRERLANLIIRKK